MDRTSLEEINKGKRNFLIIVMGFAIAIGVVAGMITTNKSEVLICSKENDKCVVEKTNYFNLKKREEVIKYSEILYPTYIPKNVAGNMYASGYSAYYLAFMSKYKKTVKIFSIEYYDKDELDNMINILKKHLKSSQKIFQIEQKL
jgi:hypothetical protein